LGKTEDQLRILYWHNSKNPETQTIM